MTVSPQQQRMQLLGSYLDSPATVDAHLAKIKSGNLNGEPLQKLFAIGVITAQQYQQAVADRAKIAAVGAARIKANPREVIEKNPSLGMLRGYDLWDGMIVAHGLDADVGGGRGVYPAGTVPIKTRIKFATLQPDIQAALETSPALFLGFVNKGEGDPWVKSYAANNAVWNQQHVSADIVGTVMKIVTVAVIAYFAWAAVGSITAGAAPVTGTAAAGGATTAATTTTAGVVVEGATAGTFAAGTGGVLGEAATYAAMTEAAGITAASGSIAADIALASAVQTGALTVEAASAYASAIATGAVSEAAVLNGLAVDYGIGTGVSGFTLADAAQKLPTSKPGAPTATTQPASPGMVDKIGAEALKVGEGLATTALLPMVTGTKKPASGRAETLTQSGGNGKQNKNIEFLMIGAAVLAAFFLG